MIVAARACSYKRLAQDVHPGSQVLIADGSCVLEVVECYPSFGTVKCRALNSATLGERKNVNLPGVIVDLPTVTEKDKDDILNWGIPNQIDFIAASFVRKGQDIVNIRVALGEAAPYIKVDGRKRTHRPLPNRQARAARLRNGGGRGAEAGAPAWACFQWPP